MQKKNVLLPIVGLLSLGIFTSCRSGGGRGDKYTKDGKLILDLTNVYFDNWKGEDQYTKIVEDKFEVSINPSNYGYNSWGEQVTSEVNANNLPDVFHFDLESFNFGNTYEFWAEGDVLKPLPSNMSKWPNIKSLLDNTTNINALTLDGKLYGIPISYDISKPEKDFSAFTYVYRRDWAKELGVYKENDIYSWDEFNAVVQAFDQKWKGNDKYYAMADVEWGFPSVTNFFKDVPHCYDKDSSGKVINGYTSPHYLEGLEVAKDFQEKKYYGYEQFSSNEGGAYDQYKGGKCGIYYENLSLSNYSKLRKDFKKNNKAVDLDDGTAIMKVKGPDGKFALEGTDNWFSITLFNYDISDNKQEKVLDIIDWLLSEEGTRLAVYGIEGYDYQMDGGEIKLLESGWEKDENGQYIDKENGAKFLRYMACLGNDYRGFDPVTDTKAYQVINSWQEEMLQAKAGGNLRIVKESDDVKWLSTPLKNENTSDLINKANTFVMQYCYKKEGLESIDKYVAKMADDYKWKSTLAEINKKLGF